MGRWLGIAGVLLVATAAAYTRADQSPAIVPLPADGPVVAGESGTV